MKNQKVTIMGIVSIALVVLALQVQRADSQSGPPSSSHSFNSHYVDFDANLQTGESTEVISLPLSDRAVRLSYSYNSADGDFTFGELVCYHRTTLNEFWTDLGQIAPENYPNGYSLGGLLWFVNTTNGTFYFKEDFGTNGSLHIAMWY